MRDVLLSVRLVRLGIAMSSTLVRCGNSSRLMLLSRLSPPSFRSLIGLPVRFNAALDARSLTLVKDWSSVMATLVIWLLLASRLVSAVILSRTSLVARLSEMLSLVIVSLPDRPAKSRIWLWDRSISLRYCRLRMGVSVVIRLLDASSECRLMK